MSRRTALQAIGLVALYVAGGAAQSAAQSIERLRLGYDIVYSGVTVAVLDVDATVTPRAFAMTTYAATTGLFNTLIPLTVQSRSEGQMAAGRPVPVLHTSESRGRSSVRMVRAEYQDGRLVRYERRVVPPDPSVESYIPDAERQGATDPASAILGLVLAVADGRGCNGEVTSFDGRRLHHIRFADGGRQYSPASVPASLAQPTILCTFAYHSRDGVEPNSPTRTGRAWIGRVRADGATAPLRVDLETRWGTASVQLRAPADTAAATTPIP